MLVAQKQDRDPALGAAHAGNDSTVTRYIYFKDDQNRIDGKYPIGTVVVKEAYNPEDTYHGYTAVEKRGNNFNASGGNWEWFVLAGDGQIATDEGGSYMRGANLMGGCLCWLPFASDWKRLFFCEAVINPVGYY